MKRFLVALIILSFLMFPFQKVAKAESNDLIYYSQFEPFQKAYDEHTSSLLYNIAATYSDNKEMFVNNFERFREYQSELLGVNSESWLGQSIGGLINHSILAHPLAFVKTIGDTVLNGFKSIFNRFGWLEGAENTGITGSTTDFLAPEGYTFEYFHYDTTRYHPRVIITRYSGYYMYRFATANNEAGYNLLVERFTGDDPVYDQMVTKELNGTATPAEFIALANNRTSANIRLVAIGTYEERPLFNTRLPEDIQTIQNEIVNIINNPPPIMERDYTPNVQPVLSCPSTTLNLQFENDSLKYNDLLLEFTTEGFTTYNNENCELDFEFPNVLYHADSNTLLVGDENWSLDVPVVQPIDNSLIAYIRNSYEYATTVINSGVNGLKSIVAGTAGLITFSGTLFGFLPPELLTLFIGGFGVALGLWVFKK